MRVFNVLEKISLCFGEIARSLLIAYPSTAKAASIDTLKLHNLYNVGSWFEGKHNGNKASSIEIQYTLNKSKHSSNDFMKCFLYIVYKAIS